MYNTVKQAISMLLERENTIIHPSQSNLYEKIPDKKDEKKSRESLYT